MGKRVNFDDMKMSRRIIKEKKRTSESFQRLDGNKEPSFFKKYKQV